MRSFFSHRRATFRLHGIFTRSGFPTTNLFTSRALSLSPTVQWAMPPLKVLRSRQSAQLSLLLTGFVSASSGSEIGPSPTSAFMEQMVILCQVASIANMAMFATCFTDLSMKNTWLISLVHERTEMAV